MASMSLTESIADTQPTYSPLPVELSSFDLPEFDWYSHLFDEPSAKTDYLTNHLSPDLTRPDLPMTDQSALAMDQPLNPPDECLPEKTPAATSVASGEKTHPRGSSLNQTRSSPLVVDETVSIGEQSPRPVRDEYPRDTTAVAGDGACEPKSAIEIENLFKTLRRKLQNGLLTEGQGLKGQDMTTMSVYLGQLEDVKTPSGAVIRAMRMTTLLRKIKGVKNIPGDGNLRITERATRLHKKFKAILRSEDETARAELIDLTGVSDSEQSFEPTSDHRVEGEMSRNWHKTAHSVDSGNCASSSSENDHPQPRTAQGLPKRKRSDSEEVLPTDSSRVGGSSIAAPMNAATRTSHRRPKRQRTSLEDYMGRENVWMKESLKRVNTLAELNAEEVKLGDKMKGLCEEMEALKATMGKLSEEREAHLKEFKADLSIWMVEDQKVTEEWEASE
ncbi:hypothetical protein DL98DRAFT_657776 [Cadophora sp. DSE1049]|nr:hypothetical protein DL98DRAFT_657776 [Cadophora sp. DSE1049]